MAATRKMISHNKKTVGGGARRTVLSIGIAILFVLFIGYAIETLYPSPNWEDYCSRYDVPEPIQSEVSCIAAGGEWKNFSAVGKPLEAESAQTGWCDVTSKCQGEYDRESESYNRNLFFISLVIGIITVVVAAMLLVETVSAGFMGGGILLIIYGTLRNWGSLSNIWRTIMLGFALGVLVWVGYKKLEK